MPRSRRDRSQPAPPTAEELNALINAQPWEVQASLFHLRMLQPGTPEQRHILAMLDTYWRARDALERLAGLASEQIDPKGVLQQTGKQVVSARRLRITFNHFKVLLHRARQALKVLAETMPPFSS
jgi:hypothetical protein